MRQRRIGGWPVGAVGLGALPLSVEGRPDRKRALSTVHAALECGVNLIDTADCYGIGPAETGHNERLIAEALRTWRSGGDEVLVATKGGQFRTPDGGYHANGHPDHLKRACEASLRALQRDAIDLYQLHTVDPAVPLLESVGALRELVDEGKVRMVGLSNVSVQQLESARTVVPVVSVQNRFSPTSARSREVLDHCTRTDVAFLPWAPLGGLAAGGAEPSGVPAFREIAAERGWSVQRVCLAWHLALSPITIPIPGASRPRSAIDSALAGDAELTPGELSRIEGELRMVDQASAEGR